MTIYSDLTQLIGNTPLLYLNKLANLCGVAQNVIIGKLEKCNPLGSIKDRAAFSMLKTAMDDGLINNDTVIVEATSGNTGIALAYQCAILGLKLKLTMPDTMSIERVRLLQALGADLYLTDGKRGMTASVEKANELLAENPNSFNPNQFNNPSNAAIHYRTTAKEIITDTDGKVDYVVCGIGSAGTIMGISQGVKEFNPDIKVVGVEPASSPLLTKGYSAPHKLQGIGANFVPPCLDLKAVDEIFPVTDEDAYAVCRKAASCEGLLMGVSSGAAVAAAIQIAKREAHKGKPLRIVAILADSGERYLTTQGLFTD